MTVSVPSNLVRTYAGDGVSVNFSYPIRFDADDELVVILRDAEGVDTVQTLNTDYTVSGEGTASGSVTFGTAPASGVTVVLYRDTKETQVVDLEDAQRTPANAVELQLDRTVRMIQDHKSLLSRSVLMRPGSGGVVFPEPSANKIIGWNSDADALENKTLVDTTVPLPVAANRYVKTDANGDPVLTSAAQAAKLDAWADNGTENIGITGRELLEAETEGDARDVLGIEAFSTVSAASASAFPVAPDFLRTAGYAAAGDGGAALYKKAASEPSHDGKFSITLADGVTTVWYELAETVVNYAMFGVDLTGATEADAGMVSCHEYANATGSKVVQKWGRVLWHTAPIPVKTDCDLAGLTITMDVDSGTTTLTYNSPYCFHIQRSTAEISATPTEISELETTHASELVPGSTRITHDLFVNNPFSFFIFETSNTDIMRNGSQTILVKDTAVTSRLGNLVVGLNKDVSTNISALTIYPREASRLRFIAPHFEANGVASVQLIYVQRNQTDIEGMIFKEIVTTPTSTRTLVDFGRCWDVTLNGVGVEGMQDFGYGTYGINHNLCVHVKVSNAWGFGGYGIHGCNYTKGVVFEDSVVNRVDGHWAVYDVSIDRCTIINDTVGVAGGGYLRIRNCKWRITAPNDVDGGESFGGNFVFPRGDYGSEFDGIIEIDGLTIEVGDTLTDLTALAIVRNGSSQSFDPGRDCVGVQKIIVRNVTLELPDNIATGYASADRFVLYGVWLDAQLTHANARKMYWPTDIVIENVSAKWATTGGPAWVNIRALNSGVFANASVYVRDDLNDTVARYGTNCSVMIRNIQDAWRGWLAQAATSDIVIGLVALRASVSGRDAHYADMDSWHPNIVVENCNYGLFDVNYDGKLTIMNSHVGRLNDYNVSAASVAVKCIGCDVKPIDQNATAGAVTYNMGSASLAVSYIGCDFYKPVDDDGTTFVSAVSLSTAKGIGNRLIDATSGTHYTSVPSNFFL